MRREGVFSSVITLEKSKNQKTKKQDSTLKKQDSTLKKSQGKEKMQFCENSWFCGKHHKPAHFWKKKNLNLTPAFSFPKKKKNFENEKS